MGYKFMVKIWLGDGTERFYLFIPNKASKLGKFFRELGTCLSWFQNLQGEARTLYGGSATSQN